MDRSDRWTHGCSHAGKMRSSTRTITADPTTPTTTTHMTRKKTGRDSAQKRRRRSRSCSTHSHMAWEDKATQCMTGQTDRHTNKPTQDQLGSENLPWNCSFFQKRSNSCGQDEMMITTRCVIRQKSEGKYLKLSFWILQNIGYTFYFLDFVPIR